MSAIANIQEKGTNGPIRKEKAVKVPLKVSAIKKNELPLTDESTKLLVDPVVIAITCGKFSQELVLHRPIGAHKLRKEDWVLTPISEVQTLLAAAEDPSRSKKEAARAKARVDHLISLKKYIKEGDVLCYPKEIAGGKALAVVNQEAKALWEQAKKHAHEDYLRECASKNTKPKQDWKFGQTENHFLPKEVIEYEQKINKDLRADATFLDKLKKLDPVPYETLAGQYSDRPQIPVCPDKEFSQEQMVDAVKKHLTTTMTGYAFPAPPAKKSLAALESAGKDHDKTMQAIASLFVRPPPPT